MPYEWHGSGPLRRGREPDDWVAPGEAFEPTDAERSAFPDLIRETGDDEPADADANPGVAAVEPPFDPAEYSVSDLRDHLADNEYSDAEIDALEAAERDGKDRTTAVEAITGLR